MNNRRDEQPTRKGLIGYIKSRYSSDSSNMETQVIDANKNPVREFVKGAGVGAPVIWIVAPVLGAKDLIQQGKPVTRQAATRGMVLTAGGFVPTIAVSIFLKSKLTSNNASDTEKLAASFVAGAVSGAASCVPEHIALQKRIAQENISTWGVLRQMYMSNRCRKLPYGMTPTMIREAGFSVGYQWEADQIREQWYSWCNHQPMIIQNASWCMMGVGAGIAINCALNIRSQKTAAKNVLRHIRPQMSDRTLAGSTTREVMRLMSKQRNIQMGVAGFVVALGILINRWPDKPWVADMVSALVVSGPVSVVTTPPDVWRGAKQRYKFAK